MTMLVYLLTAALFFQSRFSLVLCASVYADVWCHSDQANSTALTSTQYEQLIELAESNLIGELRRQRVTQPAAWSAEHAGKARDERKRELIDCVKACKVYGYNFCVNILGCPGRRRFMMETDDDSDSQRALATMKEVLEATLPDVTLKAFRSFALDANLCDKTCVDALLTSQCEAIIEVV